MKNAKLDAALGERGKGLENRSIVGAPPPTPPGNHAGILDHDIFEIGGSHPNTLLRLEHGLRDP